MTHSEPSNALFSTFVRLGKFCKKQPAPEHEQTGDMAVFGLLFREMQFGGVPRMRMTDLSRYLMISKPAATQAVNHLVAQGLVERVSEPADRRVVYIQATEAGIEKFDAELNRGLSMTDRVVARMGTQNAAQLVTLMNQFLDAMILETEKPEDK